MDFTVAGSVMAALLIALPAVGAYFTRQTRQVRRQNRQLRTLVMEQDIWLHHLERSGWTLRGLRPPERPPLLRPVNDDDEDAERAPTPATGSGRSDRPETGGGPRHGAP